jgi:hypothetical protein
MSLAQIRSVLEGTALTLESVLRMQVDSLRSRRDMAEKALGVVEAALARVVSKQSLSVDELCALVSGLETSDRSVRNREVINQLLTAEEEREWLTWMSTHQRGRGESGRRFYEAYRAVAKQFVVLFERGAKPDGPEAQALIVKSNALMTTHSMREYSLELESWNAKVAEKWRAIGERIYYGDPQTGESSAGLRQFTFRAWAAAPSTARLAAILERARACARAGGAAHGGAARRDPSVARVIADFKALCQAYDLGDPVIFARWQASNSRNGHTYGLKPPADASEMWEWLAAAA